MVNGNNQSGAASGMAGKWNLQLPARGRQLPDTMTLASETAYEKVDGVLRP